MLQIRLQDLALPENNGSKSNLIGHNSLAIVPAKRLTCFIVFN